jgi:hypothetical protein
MNYQLHALASLSPGKTTVPYTAGLDMLAKRKLPTPDHNRTPVIWTAALTILTELPRIVFNHTLGDNIKMGVGGVGLKMWAGWGFRSITVNVCIPVSALSSLATSVAVLGLLGDSKMEQVLGLPSVRFRFPVVLCGGLMDDSHMRLWWG